MKNKKILLAMTGIILSLIFTSGVYAQRSIAITNIGDEQYAAFKTKGAYIYVVPAKTAQNEVMSRYVAYSRNPPDYIATLPDKSLALGLFTPDSKPYTGKGTFDLWLVDGNGVGSPIAYKADSVNVNGQITLEFSSFTKTQSFKEIYLAEYQSIAPDSAPTKFEGKWKHPNKDAENATISFSGNSFSYTWDNGTVNGRIVFDNKNITLISDDGMKWTTPYSLSKTALNLTKGGGWWWYGSFNKQ